ncbi:MAG: hypothetical protein HOP28_07825, partial [Gemmatimonadales bacterium]|nr:hypothetical protein [Gemmatimonadales bacterium]
MTPTLRLVWPLGVALLIGLLSGVTAFGVLGAIVSAIFAVRARGRRALGLAWPARPSAIAGLALLGA